MRFPPAVALLAVLAGGSVVSAQAPTTGNTLRYGSGLLDVPVASVLPHLNIRGSYSGFWTHVDRTVRLDPSGNAAGSGPGGSDYHDDAAVVVGLFDRMELGLSVQSLGDRETGGNMFGAFGRVNVVQPRDQGIGLAVGGRYVTGPTFADGVERAAGRLGFPDPRLVRRFEGSDRTMRTSLSLYGVVTAQLRGFDASRIPENDLTLSLGWGGGMFRSQPGTELYGEGANGWFLGASSHWRLGAQSVLQVMAEHNGFDVNVGAQFESRGGRIGLHALGVNHPRPSGGYTSEYRSPKMGFSVSFSVCPGAARLRCQAKLMERVEPDTIWIPPPPPDTVVIGQREPPPPEGEPATLCLSTGQNVPIRITTAGDTLVGPAGTPVASLRPVMDFAGQYAGGANWYERGEEFVFEGERFVPVGAPFDIDCSQILRVGAYQGVPLFADRAAVRPIEVVFVPVGLGVWQRYEHPEDMVYAVSERFPPNPLHSILNGRVNPFMAPSERTLFRSSRHIS